MNPLPFILVSGLWHTPVLRIHLPQQRDRSDSNVLLAQPRLTGRSRAPRWGRLITVSLHMSAHLCTTAAPHIYVRQETVMELRKSCQAAETEFSLLCELVQRGKLHWGDSLLWRGYKQEKESFLSPIRVINYKGDGAAVLIRRKGDSVERWKGKKAWRRRQLLKRSNTGEGDMCCYGYQSPLSSPPPFFPADKLAFQRQRKHKGRGRIRWRKDRRTLGGGSNADA